MLNIDGKRSPGRRRGGEGLRGPSARARPAALLVHGG